MLILALFAAPATAQTQEQAQQAQQVIASLERDGWFVECNRGLGVACHLFLRLVAVTLNPNMQSGSWGLLTKNPGEHGCSNTACGNTLSGHFGEDALVWGGDASWPVYDIIAGAGEPGARIAWQSVPRRETNRWHAPVPLSTTDLARLRSGAEPEPPLPPPPTSCAECERMWAEDRARYEALLESAERTAFEWQEVATNAVSEHKAAERAHANALAERDEAREQLRTVRETCIPPRLFGVIPIGSCRWP